MRNKESNLLQDIKTYTKQKNFYKNQAKFAKYACIFACCGTGIATIAAFVNAAETSSGDDTAALFGLTAIGFALAAYATYETHKANSKMVNKYRNKIQKINRALKNLHKTR